MPYSPVQEQGFLQSSCRLYPCLVFHSPRLEVALVSPLYLTREFSQLKDGADVDGLLRGQLRKESKLPTATKIHNENSPDLVPRSTAAKISLSLSYSFIYLTKLMRREIRAAKIAHINEESLPVSSLP